MASDTYDIIIVGGGLGGSTLAKVMAEHGARVLVLEREKQFKDRVRGEQMHPWGVTEARALGIYDLLRTTCGHELPWWDRYLGSEQTGHRNLVATTPHHAPEFAFYHPTMQEILLQTAVAAGAEVHRGATVRDVKPGTVPTVVVDEEGHVEELHARLVVGADGRTSLVRKWGGFTVRRDPPRLLIAGVLFEDMAAAEDTAYMIFNPGIGQTVPLFPQGGGRVRAYLIYQHEAAHRLQGEADIPRFIAESIRTGVPAAFYSHARAAGPLATFEGADTWVEHPYRDGIALVGDAAASNDPAYGEGLSLTVRDVRVLRDRLLSQEDWAAAGHEYAEEHDRHYGVIHMVSQWFGELFYTVGPEAEARLARALPLLAQDGSRVPDHLFSGPDLPVDETVRRRFFGEE
jgi:2-polyprenyl-6-methoxyphenol hydroxylase-like FAD-dependent oxidoreductase